MKTTSRPKARSGEVSSSTEAFAVSVGGRVVGHLFQRGDYAWLEWQEGYWDDPNRPVLGLRFESNPHERVSAALRLPPWFSNLLPEGRLRDWVARDAHVSSEREMMLLRRLGADLPGAVAVEKTDTVDARWQPGRMLDPPAPRPTEQGPLRFSLAGVALKFSMLQRGDRLTLPGRGERGDWIVKMPDAVYPRVPENEFAVMSLAKGVGLDVPDITLRHRDQLPPLPNDAWPTGQDMAYAIRRFDRTPDGGRIHMEDMCQVRGFYPEDKYRGSFDTVAALVYRRRDLGSYLEYVRRLFFSFAAGNGDMHLKNVSLIYPGGRRPVLSPAYDLVCTAPYVDGNEDLGLKLGRSRRFDSVTPSSFELLAARVGAPVDATMTAISDVSSRLEATWHRERDKMADLPEHARYLDERLPRVASKFR